MPVMKQIELLNVIGRMTAINAFDFFGKHFNLYCLYPVVLSNAQLTTSSEFLKFFTS